MILDATILDVTALDATDLGVFLVAFDIAALDTTTLGRSFLDTAAWEGTGVEGDSSGMAVFKAAMAADLVVALLVVLGADL